MAAQKDWLFQRLDAQSRARAIKVGQQAHRPIQADLPLWWRLHDRQWRGGGYVTDRLRRDRQRLL